MSTRVTFSVCLMVGLATAGSALAQSAGSAIDQPTAGTLPAGTSTVKGGERHVPNGRVSAPSALEPSTGVIAGGESSGQRVNPKEHLPDSMRRNR